MSFYSYKNADNEVCPGRIRGEATKHLTERVCIQVKRVYDSCLQQEQLENVRLTLTDICPATTDFCPPLTFISCRSCQSRGIIRHLMIDRLEDRPNFARVRACVDIPLDVLFEDCNGKKGSGYAVLTIKKDVILYVPDESIIPFTAEAIASAICVSGTYVNDFTFSVTICVTVIIKIVAEVELLVPSYGFCKIPPCEEFGDNVCEEFFGLPIFPPTMKDDCGCQC